MEVSPQRCSKQGTYKSEHLPVTPKSLPSVIGGDGLHLLYVSCMLYGNADFGLIQVKLSLNPILLPHHSDLKQQMCHHRASLDFFVCVQKVSNS